VDIGDRAVEGTRHEGEEILLVTAGRLKVTVGEESYDLGEGDCIQFRGSLPHRFEKAGGGEPQALWVTASEGLLSP